MYHDLKWSQSERKVARRAYDTALETELAQIIAEFKARASVVQAPGEMWELEDYLNDKRREIQEKYDYRYSRLILTFARLLREERIREDDLVGLSEEKLSYIARIASLWGDGVLNHPLVLTKEDPHGSLGSAGPDARQYTASRHEPLRKLWN